MPRPPLFFGPWQSHFSFCVSLLSGLVIEFDFPSYYTAKLLLEQLVARLIDERMELGFCTILWRELALWGAHAEFGIEQRSFCQLLASGEISLESNGAIHLTLVIQKAIPQESECSQGVCGTNAPDASGLQMAAAHHRQGKTFAHDIPGTAPQEFRGLLASCRYCPAVTRYCRCGARPLHWSKSQSKTWRCPMCLNENVPT